MPTNAELYDLKEAADYVLLSIAGLKYHVYTTGKLKPTARRFGRVLFNRKTLDAFKKQMGMLGRQPAGMATAKYKIANAAERARKAAELYRGGKSLAQVAKLLGYTSISSVSRAISIGQARENEAA